MLTHSGQNTISTFLQMGKTKPILISQFTDDHSFFLNHYCDVIMCTMASQITSLTIVYSTLNPGADQRSHQSSASLAFVRGIYRGPVNSPNKWLLTRKLFHLMTSSRLSQYRTSRMATAIFFSMIIMIQTQGKWLNLLFAHHKTVYDLDST